MVLIFFSLNPLTPVSDYLVRQNFSLPDQYNIKQASDEKKIYQLGDY